MKGAIGPGVVPGVLRSIYLGRRTGMLRFIRDEERRSVRFMGGHIVYGEASVPELRLGAVLVAAGRLEAAAVERAALVVQKERRRLGTVLTEMGILDDNGLEEALALHVRAILTSVFSLRAGTYTFQEQDPEAFLDDDWPLAVSTAEAVLAAVRAVASPEDVRFAIGSLDRALLASDEPLLLYQRMDLGAEEAALLARVDGTHSAREVLRASGLGGGAGERALLALLSIGVVEYGVEAPAAEAAAPGERRREILEMHAALARRSANELLGVAPDASAADLKAAYFRLAKRFHPDVVHEPGLADLREKLEAIFFRLHDAYRTVTGRPASGAPARASSATVPTSVPGQAAAPAAAAATAPAPSPAGAVGFEESLREGRERLGEGKTWEAAMIFEQIVGGAEGRMRTRARVLLGRALLALPDREKPAEKALQEAVKDDPDHVEAHYLLGTLYRRRGLPTRARSMFRRALELDPHHRASLAEMDALSADPPSPASAAPRRSSRR
jgi:tetratricopeptide (TPR) repeat protein